MYAIHNENTLHVQKMKYLLTNCLASSFWYLHIAAIHTSQNRRLLKSTLSSFGRAQRAKKELPAKHIQDPSLPKLVHSKFYDLWAHFKTIN